MEEMYRRALKHIREITAEQFKNEIKNKTFAEIVLKGGREKDYNQTEIV